MEVRSAAGTRVVVDAGTGMPEAPARSLPRVRLGAATSTCSSATRTGITSRGCRTSGRSTSAATSCRSTRASATILHLQAVFFCRPKNRISRVPFAEGARGDRLSPELAELGQVRENLQHEGRLRAARPPLRRHGPYRLTADGGSVVSASQTRSLERYSFRRRVRRAAAVARRGAAGQGQAEAGPHARSDLVVYDTMFTANDYRRIPHYGHSRPLTPWTSSARRGPSGCYFFITRPSAATPRNRPHPRRHADLSRARGHGAGIGGQLSRGWTSR